jgi:hypothetical protein
LKSDKYLLKLQKRDEREPQRELLKKAKEIYYETYGSKKPLIRYRLNEIKKKLLRE